MIASPYFWLGLLIAFLIIFGKGYDTGARHAREHAAAEQLEAVAQARIEAIEQAKADQQTAENFEVARENVRTVYIKVKEKALENIEKHPDYAACGLDADGLRLYNHNPNHSEATAPGADSTLPGFAGRAGWKTINDPEQQSGTLADVLRLPVAPQSIVGLVNPTVGADSIRPETK